MSVVDGWYDHQDEHEWRVNERVELTRFVSAAVIGLTMIPLWLFGILVFLWKSATGRMPWGPDQPPPGADVLTLAYLLGGTGTTAVGAVVLLLAAVAASRRIQNWWRRV